MIDIFREKHLTKEQFINACLELCDKIKEDFGFDLIEVWNELEKMEREKEEFYFG